MMAHKLKLKVAVKLKMTPFTVSVFKCSPVTVTVILSALAQCKTLTR